MEKMVQFGISLRRAISAAVVVLALAGITFSMWGVKDAAAAGPAAEVIYPLKTFQDGKARFYNFPAGNGITIKYFVLRSSDGVIRAAFDACDVCWQEGKGYVQKGDFMVCTNCGRRFASVRVNEVQGGCNPAPLNREIRGDKVILQVKDIQQGEKYFAFEKRGGR
ncbi:MAG: DUF2318 domain-containing protein [Smithellaceae bacterium]|nr:DUF2318 domain-containing protein [Smithellaceae bacterium]